MFTPSQTDQFNIHPNPNGDSTVAHPQLVHTGNEIWLSFLEAQMPQKNLLWLVHCVWKFARVGFAMLGVPVDQGSFLFDAPAAPDHLVTESRRHLRRSKSRSKLWRRGVQHNFGKGTCLVHQSTKECPSFVRGISEGRGIPLKTAISKFWRKRIAGLKEVWKKPSRDGPSPNRRGALCHQLSSTCNNVLTSHPRLSCLKDGHQQAVFSPGRWTTG